MENIINSSIARYHEKKANKFLEKWIEKNVSLPSKEKALKFLRKNIKTEKDLEEVYRNLPRLISFLKSKKAANDKILPPGFVKNLAALVAMLSILGSLTSKEKAMNELKKHDVVVKQEKEYKPEKQYLGEMLLDEAVVKKINPKKSVEDMNRILLEEAKDLKEPKVHKLNEVKYPLALKFTTDRAGDVQVFPSTIKKLKEGDKLFIHRVYSPEKIEKIEKNVKEIQEESKKKYDKV